MNLKHFSQLDEKKQRAIVLKSQGIKQEAIAEEIGVTDVTLWRWFGQDGSLLKEYHEYTAWQAQAKQKNELSLQEKLATYAEECLEHLMALAINKTGKVKQTVQQAALDSILDRSGVVRGSKSENYTEFRDLEKEKQDFKAQIFRMVKRAE